MPPKKRSRKSIAAKGSKTKKAKKQADAGVVAAASIVPVEAPRIRKNAECSRCSAMDRVTERFDEETSRIRWYCGECMAIVKDAEQKIASGELKVEPMSAKTLKDVKMNVGVCTVCSVISTRTQVEDDTQEKTLHLCAVCLPLWSHNKKIPEDAKEKKTHSVVECAIYGCGTRDWDYKMFECGAADCIPHLICSACRIKEFHCVACKIIPMCGAHIGEQCPSCAASSSSSATAPKKKKEKKKATSKSADDEKKCKKAGCKNKAAPKKKESKPKEYTKGICSVCGPPGGGYVSTCDICGRLNCSKFHSVRCSIAGCKKRVCGRTDDDGLLHAMHSANRCDGNGGDCLAPICNTHIVTKCKKCARLESFKENVAVVAAHKAGTPDAKSKKIAKGKCKNCHCRNELLTESVDMNGDIGWFCEDCTKSFEEQYEEARVSAKEGIS
jgi:hypothetical protein